MMDLTWYQMPQQQQLPGYGGGVGGDAAEGNEAGAGGGSGAGGGTGGEGGGDAREGGDRQDRARATREQEAAPRGHLTGEALREDMRARQIRDIGTTTPSRPAAGPTGGIGTIRGHVATFMGLNPEDDSWSVTADENGTFGIDARGASFDTLMAAHKESLTGFAKAFDTLFSNTTFGRVATFGMRLFGTRFNLDGTPTKGEGIDTSGEGAEEVQNQQRKRPGEETTEDDGRTLPEPGTDAYRDLLRSTAERILGDRFGFADEAFDFADYNTLIALDGIEPIPGLEGSDLSGAQADFDRDYQAILDRIFEEEP